MDSDTNKDRKRKRASADVDTGEAAEINIKVENNGKDKEKGAPTKAGPGVPAAGQGQKKDIADADDDNSRESMTFLDIRRNFQEARRSANYANGQLRLVEADAQKQHKEFEDKIKQQRDDFKTYLQKTRSSREVAYSEEQQESNKQIDLWSANADSQADSRGPK